MAIVQNPNNNNITGARASLVLNGVPVAWARGVSWSTSIEYSEIRTLDSLRVVAYAPVSSRTTLSFSSFRIPKGSLTAMGLYPQTGATSSDQLTNVLTLPDLTAVIVDGVTGTAIATFIGVKIAGASFSLDAGGSILASEVDCVVRSVYDESETAPAA